MKQRLIDTEYKVETPEAIDLSAQLAGPVPRALAYSIDLLIRTVILSVLFIVLGLMGKAGMGIFMLLSFFMEWFYPLFFEVLRNGQTPGKKRMHLAVVNDDLTPVTWSTSMIRNLLRVADFLPVGYLFGLISICLNRNFQRLGDIAAGSVVIHRHIPPKNLNLPAVSAQSPTFVLSIEDHVAMIGFAQRHEHLSAARQIELAELLTGVTKKEGVAAVTHLQAIGCWLLGEK